VAGQRRERADAIRNRRRILEAAENLLAEAQRMQRGSGHVSIDAVAAAAGVGKGTVFRRFGSRAELMRALVEERVRALAEAVASGQPPLGPGAPAALRLAAFLDAAVEIATRNADVMAAYDHALTAQESADFSRQTTTVYRAWHAHISALIAEADPALDAELLAHVLLGSLHSDLVRHLLARGESQRLAGTLRSLAAALLGGPPAAETSGH
jgi:AcrR family transcriptional regulator